MSERVFLEYSQPQLNDQYDQRVWAANAAEVIGLYKTASDGVRQRIGQPTTFAYGTSPAEVLDVYICDQRSAPIEVFVHGGAWRQLSRQESAFPAEPFLRAGAHFVALDFGLAPEISLQEMVTQVRRAFVWIYQNAEKFGGDFSRVYVSGHSSGAHLAGCVVTTDWTSFGLPASFIKGGLCISGIYDLEPVRLSSRNDYLRLELAAAKELSPIRHVNHIRCPIIVAYGEHESAEFVRQAKEFAAAVERTGHLQVLIEGRGYNHFEIANTLADANSPLAKAVLDQMALRRS